MARLIPESRVPTRGIRGSSYPSCPACGDLNTKKAGKHYNKTGTVQRYRCETCGISFTDSGNFKGKFPIAVVHYAVQLYSDGLSMREVSHELKSKLGVEVTYVAIGDWLRKCKVVPRPRRGKGRNARVRELVEVSVLVRYASSWQPERFVLFPDVKS